MPPSILTARNAVDPTVGKPDLPGTRIGNTGNRAQQGGLATAGRPEQRDETSGRDVEIEALQGLKPIECLRQAANGIFREWQDALGECVRETRGGSKMSKAARKDVAGFIVASYSGAMSVAKAEQSTASLRNAAAVLKRWLQAHELDR